MKATNIEWDVSDNDMTDEDSVSDYLSELTGFCVFGYVLDKI